jgi:hypothetical protein
MSTATISHEVPSNEKFHTEYQALVAKMRDLAESDGAIFLPNIEPKKPADFIFICMEPSIGHWARPIGEGKKKVEAGFRNFTASMEAMIFHFCVQQYLCKSNQTYHFTDISKGAMTIELANVDRTKRYKRWHELLLSEMDLVAAPNAKIFAVGKAVADYLEESKFPRPVNRIIHYSALSGKARADGIRGQEEDFARFKESVTLAHLVDAGNKVFDSSPQMEKFRESTLKSIASGDLSESRRKLIYIYKRAFESV